MHMADRINFRRPITPGSVVEPNSGNAVAKYSTLIAPMNASRGSRHRHGTRYKVISTCQQNCFPWCGRRRTINQAGGRPDPIIGPRTTARSRPMRPMA
jgi:hypothetical protein